MKNHMKNHEKNQLKKQLVAKFGIFWYPFFTGLGGALSCHL
jgi:hypothetical protein